MTDTLEDIKEYVKDTCYRYVTFNNPESHEDALLELASNSGYPLPEDVRQQIRERLDCQKLKLHVFVILETVNDGRRLVILYDNTADSAFCRIGLYALAPSPSTCRWSSDIRICLNYLGAHNLDSWRVKQEQVDNNEEVKQDVMSITRGMFR